MTHLKGTIEKHRHKVADLTDKLSQTTTTAAKTKARLEAEIERLKNILANTESSEQGIQIA